MKKLWIVALLAFMTLTVLGTVGQAQVKIGPKIGLSMADFSGDGVDAHDMKSGFAAGIFAQFPLGQGASLVLQPEVLYVMKGPKLDLTEETTWKYNLDYIEVPVLLKFKFPLPGNIAPNVFAGPVVSFLSSAKIKEEIDGDEVDEMDIKEFLKDTEYSIAFGGGVDVTFQGLGVLTVDARYVIGMSDISDVGEGELKNKTIMIHAGFGFKL